MFDTYRPIRNILGDRYSKERKVTKAWKDKKEKDGQSYKYILDVKTGQKKPRIKYKGSEPCHDCGVVEGQYHWLNCDMEEDPFTRKQLLSSENSGSYSK